MLFQIGNLVCKNGQKILCQFPLGDGFFKITRKALIKAILYSATHRNVFCDKQLFKIPNILELLKFNKYII